MPIGRTRKSKMQTSNLPSSPHETTTISDEEGNTSDCSQRQTSSSVYSTLESPIENVNLYVISNQPKSTIDKCHSQNDLAHIQHLNNE